MSCGTCQTATEDTIGKHSRTVLFHSLYIICKGFIYAFQKIPCRDFHTILHFLNGPRVTPSPHNGQLPLKNTKIESRWPLVVVYAIGATNINFPDVTNMIFLSTIFLRCFKY